MHLARRTALAKRGALFLDFLAPSILPTAPRIRNSSHPSQRASSSLSAGPSKWSAGAGPRERNDDAFRDRGGAARNWEERGRSREERSDLGPSSREGRGFLPEPVGFSGDPTAEVSSEFEDPGPLDEEEASFGLDGIESDLEGTGWPPEISEELTGKPPSATTSPFLPPKPSPPNPADSDARRLRGGSYESSGRTSLQLAILEGKFTPAFLTLLRAHSRMLDSRDFHDIARRLCMLPLYTAEAVSVPPDYSTADDDFSGRTDWRHPLPIELECALICSARGFSSGLRQVMLRHLVSDGPYSDAWIERAWKGIVAQKAEDDTGTGMRGHFVSEIVAVYIAMIARRAVRLADDGSGERILPASMHDPGFVKSLILSLSIVPSPLTNTHCTALLGEFVSQNVLATVQGWLRAATFARMLVQTKKLLHWLILLGKNRKVDELRALWKQCREAVDNGWVAFASMDTPTPGYGRGEDQSKAKYRTRRPKDQPPEQFRLATEEKAEADVESLQHSSYEPGLLKPSDLPLHVATSHQSAFLTTFLLVHKPDLAYEVLDFLVKNKVKLNVHHCTALITGFAKVNRGSAEAERFWEFMNTAGVEPDIRTWNAWLQALFYGRQWERGLVEFTKMQEGILPGTANLEIRKRAVGMTTWNNVLHGLFYNRREEEGRMVWREMRNLNMVDITSVNILLRYLSRQGEWTAVSQLMRSLPQLKLEPDVFTFTTVLDAVAHAGRNVQESVKMVWTVMTAQGIPFNNHVLTTVLSHLVKSRTEEGVYSALALLEEVEAAEATMDEDFDAAEKAGNKTEDGRKVYLNEVTYTAVIAGVWGSPSVPYAAREQITSDLLARMRARGLGSNRVTYHVLMKAAFGAFSAERGMELWRDMRRSEISCTTDTWQIVLRGLIQAESEFTGAEELKRSAWVVEVGEALAADNFAMPPSLELLWTRANRSLRMPERWVD